MRTGRVTGMAALPLVGRALMLVGLIGLIAAACLVVLGSGKYGATAPGRIAAVDGGYPLIEFTTPEGRTVQFNNFVRSSLWSPGDPVTVAYDPADPTKAVVDGFAGRWFLAGLAALLGAIFLVIGLVLWLIGRTALRRIGGGSA